LPRLLASILIHNGRRHQLHVIADAKSIKDQHHEREDEDHVDGRLVAPDLDELLAGNRRQGRAPHWILTRPLILTTTRRDFPSLSQIVRVPAAATFPRRCSSGFAFALIVIPRGHATVSIVSHAVPCHSTT